MYFYNSFCKFFTFFDQSPKKDEFLPNIELVPAEMNNRNTFEL